MTDFNDERDPEVVAGLTGQARERQREDAADVTPLPGRQCLCLGDGQTWADTSSCPVHDTETSPLAQAVRGTYEAGRVDALRWLVERYESALRTIRGPEDSGPWLEVYRQAGGGYEGLQAIAREALAVTEETHHA